MEIFFLTFLQATRVAALHHCFLSKASNYLYICLKAACSWGAGTSRPGPAPCDSKQTSTALGISAQWSGLGGAASYPERAGALPCNEIDSKRTKLLSTPAHPLTAMKAKRGMGNCRPQAMKEKDRKKSISSPCFSIFSLSFHGRRSMPIASHVCLWVESWRAECLSLGGELENGAAQRAAGRKG